MSDTQETTVASPTSTLSGRVLAIAFAAVIPILTGAAYLTGTSYHQAYLAAFGIPSKLIGKTTTDFFVYAHSAVTESLLIVITSAFVVVLAVGFIASFTSIVLNRLEKKAGESARIRQIRTRLNGRPSVKLMAEFLFLPALTVIILIYLIFALLFALILPQAIGGATGKQRAKEDRATFLKECPVEVGEHRLCTEIYENDNLVACGYIIDSSPEYIAVFKDGNVRTIPVANKTFVSVNSNPKNCKIPEVVRKSPRSSNLNLPAASLIFQASPQQ